MSCPRVFLAIDNCFAAKRWTRPLEWARIVQALGIAHVEASADNECDPLYCDPAYLTDWIDDVKDAYERTGVKVANLYSGHSTYSFLGLSSPDRRNQGRIQDQWLKPMIRNASQLQAGVGFCCHSFSDETLQNSASYAAAEDAVYTRLGELASFAAHCGVESIGVEQMYAPHMIPWTIQGARRLLREVCARTKSHIYLTIDVGHQSGQRKFLRPPYLRLKETLLQMRATGKPARGLWLGPKSAYGILQEAAETPIAQEDYHLNRLEREMDGHAPLFATPEDGDPYIWLGQLACYSPIIHLQQTDGSSSPHLPFTEANNQRGIILADKVLRSISAAYSQAPDSSMPPKCEKVYLTLEIFPKPTDFPLDILSELEESVAYWRAYVPKDGLKIEELVPKHEVDREQSLPSDR